MAYIRQVGDDEPTGVLKRVYDAAVSRAGGVANIIRIMSRDGRTTQSSMQFYVSLMKADNGLEARRREMLGTAYGSRN